MAENTTSRLHALHRQGQSVWLDYIRRGIIESGELEGMIREHDLLAVQEPAEREPGEQRQREPHHEREGDHRHSEYFRRRTGRLLPLVDHAG